MNTKDFDILDQKGFVGRISYDLSAEHRRKYPSYTGSRTMLVARSTRTGLGYLTEAAFMKNLKRQVNSLHSQGHTVTKVERLVVANVAMESVVVTPDELK